MNNQQEFAGWIISNFNSDCINCEKEVEVGDRIFFVVTNKIKEVYCEECGEEFQDEL